LFLRGTEVGRCDGALRTDGCVGAWVMQLPDRAALNYKVVQI